jgi:hypothetical protein
MGVDETLNNDIIIGANQIQSNTVWENFGVAQIDLNADIDVDCDETANKLAEEILTTYGIEYDDRSNASTGGALDNLDIKRQDAMTTLNLSLIERAAKSGRSFIEPVVSPEGTVEFREVGSYDGNIDDVYYEIRTGSFVESPKAVMVYGAKPLPTINDLQWIPIWGESPVKIYHMQDVFDNCRREDFIRFATIVFNDPQLSSTYRDGIDNLYEIDQNNPWERIVGYAKYIYGGSDFSKDTDIKYTNNASIPIKIGTENPGTNGPDMGTLIDLPRYDPDVFDPSCWAGQGTITPAEDGVRVNIPSEFRYTNIRGVPKDKFLSVSNVYLIGRKMNMAKYGPINSSAQLEEPTINNSKLWVSINDERGITTIRLEHGRHYSVSYEEEDGFKIPYIIFAKDVKKDDPFAYGKTQKYYLDPNCTYAEQNRFTDETVSYEGTIFPYGKREGVLVSEIWVTVELETPSITVYDPDGTNEKALNIAKNLEYYLAPIVIDEPPEPIAYAGPSTGGRAALVSQLPTSDTDPTTTEDFDDTELEQYLDEMQGAGMTITWSFLDENSVVDMADLLYEHFQSDVIETVYTCGPDCNPILGGYGEGGGIVNSVRYNYSDSGSYTVSVTEGPRLIGNLTPVDGGPTMKMSESHSATGTVLQVAGDNLHFKVRIDGYGERWAINMAHTILRKGDVVNCTVHNNPIEA